jgi:hypothetical protein
MASWSGLYDGFFKQPYAPLAAGNTTDYNKTKWNELARLTRRGPAGRKLGAIIRTLTGQAPGSPMSVGTTRVPASPAPGQSYSGGGYIYRTTQTELARNTNSTDEVWVDTATQLKNKLHSLV